MYRTHKYAVLAIMAITASLSAQATKPASGHDGIFLNANGGLGYGIFTESSGNQTASYTGLGFQYGAKLGFSLNENIVLYGAIDGHSLSNPTFTVTNGSATASTSTNNLTYSVFMYGAGIGFRTDSNFFIRTTLGVAKGTLSSGIASLSTDAGFGANLNIGQEWMVSDKFGIGVAGVAHYSNVKDGTLSAHQFYFGVAVSATYN